MAAKRKPKHEARTARNNVYREHVFAAAEQVFAERGFEATKVQDISRLVGLSMGTIYAVFPSKEDLFRAILEARGGELLLVARAVVARHLPPRETLRALSEAYIEYFFAHPNFLRMHLREGTSWVLSPTLEADTRAQLWKDIHDLQTDIFRRGIAAGVFLEESPAYLAKLFSAMDQVLLAEWVAGDMKADRTQLARRLQQLVERAFCAAPLPVR
ncbi:MAG: TetR/AcrR family transcriptional regulator, partial [Gaiellaceae bacterium]